MIAYAYWPVVIAVTLCCLLWAIVGFELCRITHKQRGIEVDRPITDNLPLPPPPVIVPNTADELLAEIDRK